MWAGARSLDGVTDGCAGLLVLSTFLLWGWPDFSLPSCVSGQTYWRYANATEQREWYEALQQRQSQSNRIVAASAAPASNPVSAQPQAVVAEMELQQRRGR